MKRRLFTILSAVSITLCAAMIGLWVRSYWRCDMLTGGANTPPSIRAWSISSENGCVSVDWAALTILIRTEGILPLDMITKEETQGFHWTTTRSFRPHNVIRGLARFGWRGFLDDKLHFRTAVYGLVFPYWLPLLLASIYPAIWIRQKRLEQRRGRLGCCLSCGYDLRASADRCRSAARRSPRLPQRLMGGREDARPGRI